MTTVAAALISAISSITVGVLTLMGVVITNSRVNRDIEQKITVAQAVTDTKLAELTREVREHNQMVKRVPVVEEQMKVVNHRIADIENILN
ncbi:MAG: hypothetical protein IJD71_04330 [Clostridia bacterium]|nr:hypothetical protein [Clostridia bacterium]MBQ7108380.1 hypothetical protein [Clostridia bacterium]MBQ9920502.1 hypothetical protein [Clostridia bacterium]